MRLFNKINLLVLIMILVPKIIFGATEESSVIWKATYYASMPNQKNISQEYCNQHEPGTFIGTVQEQLKTGASTNHQVKLSHFTLHQTINNGIYFMNGTLFANGKRNGKDWHDIIHYYVYKLTPNGMTQGVWSSQQCKGLYLGTAAPNNVY